MDFVKLGKEYINTPEEEEKLEENKNKAINIPY